jgi:glycosyltransferase involved in cell wall biosynthesis
MSQRPSVLVISTEPIAAKMAGPAIRAFELAKAMSDDCEVTLAAPSPSVFPEDLPFFTRETQLEGDEAFEHELAKFNVVVVQLWPIHRTRYLAGRVKRLVLDMYCPVYLESLEASRGQDDRSRAAWHGWMATEIANALKAADYILCASERQRDMLLGAMMVSGRIEPHTYAEDGTYRSVIDVVPYGTPEDPPVSTKRVMKGILPGIKETDKVLLWGGGVWNWLDPMTAIKAVEKIAETRDDVKLVFMSLSRSHAADRIDFSAAAQALKYARDRDLEDKCVFFQTDWIPYDGRADYLLEADLGISTHTDHLETRFSLRSRLLDCVWAGLPIVATRGDASAEWIEQRGLGKTVDFENVDELAAACIELLDNRELYQEVQGNLAEFAKESTWKKAAAPLIAYATAAPALPLRRRDPASLRMRAVLHFPSRLRAVYYREGPVSLTRFAIRRFFNGNGNGHVAGDASSSEPAPPESPNGYPPQPSLDSEKVT